jgi:hypothetical protein
VGAWQAAVDLLSRTWVVLLRRVNPIVAPREWLGVYTDSLVDTPMVVFQGGQELTLKVGSGPKHSWLLFFVHLH